MSNPPTIKYIPVVKNAEGHALKVTITSTYEVEPDIDGDLIADRMTRSTVTSVSCKSCGVLETEAAKEAHGVNAVDFGVIEARWLA